MRHLLSVAILSEHCYIIGLGKYFNIGYEKNDFIRQAHSLTSKQFAIEAVRPFMFSLVGAFFVLSGFLVFGSALRNKNLKDFFILRIIRIVPALSVEVTISALMIGPTVTSYALSQYFSNVAFFAYFGNIIGMIKFNLPGVFPDNPTPNTVNGNLWTLPAELECYIILGLFIFLGLVRDKWKFLSILICAAVVISALSVYGLFDVRGTNVAYSPRYIVFLFFLGVLSYMFSDKIPVNSCVFIASVIFYYLASLVKAPDIICAPALVYAVLFVGCCDYSTFDRRIGGDYSYGIYLYGYPITQTVMYFLKDRITLGEGGKVILLGAISIPLTCLVAFLSWHLIERNCLKLRRLLIKRAPAAV